MRFFVGNLAVYLIVFISLRNVLALSTPAPSASPSSGPSMSNVPSTSRQPSKSAEPTTAQSPSHEPSKSVEPTDSAEPTTAQSFSPEPSISVQPTESPEPTNILPSSAEPSMSAQPSESAEPTNIQPPSDEPSMSAQPSESAEPTNSQSPSDEPSISSRPSTPPSGPPSTSPESKCIITLGRVRPICLQTSISGGFACFVLEDLVPFQTSPECRSPTVTFDSCKESKVVMKSLYPDLFLTVDSQIQTSPAINDQGENTGSSSLEQLLSKVKSDVEAVLGRHGNEDGTVHIESVVGDNAERDDNGAYTELPESIPEYISEHLSGRRHRRQPMDGRPPSSPNQRRQDVTRFLAQRDRDHAISSRTIKRSPGVIGKGEKASKGNKNVVTARREKSLKKGGMMKGNRSMRMMSMSTKKTANRKSGMMGAPVSSEATSTASIIPSAAPSPGVNQRSQDFTAADCDTPCVDFGEVLCLRASMLTSLALITSVSYTVSDAGGSSQSFEMDVRIASAASCIATLSKCIDKRVPK